MSTQAQIATIFNRRGRQRFHALASSDENLEVLVLDAVEEIIEHDIVLLKEVRVLYG